MALAWPSLPEITQQDSYSLTLGSKVFDLHANACLLGVLNVTPDSFWAGSRVGGALYVLKDTGQEGLMAARYRRRISAIMSRSRHLVRLRSGSRAVKRTRIPA